MFGNLLSNTLINQLVKQNIIHISPFDEKQLQVAQYPLTPDVVWEVIAEKEGKRVHDFSERTKNFSLKAKSYYWIDILEIIKLPSGIVGRFIPSSNLIEKGLALTAGKIEKPFGDKNQKVRFGLYNYLNTPVMLENTRIAYIQFMDMRGLNLKDYKPTSYDKTVYADRFIKELAEKIADDGGNWENA